MLPMLATIGTGRRKVLPVNTTSIDVFGLRVNFVGFRPARLVFRRSRSLNLPISAPPPSLVTLPTSPEFCPFCIYSSQASSEKSI